MKFPNHLTLDLYSRKNILTIAHWNKMYFKVLIETKRPLIALSLFYKFYLTTHDTIAFLENLPKFTIIYKKFTPQSARFLKNPRQPLFNQTLDSKKTNKIVKLRLRAMAISALKGRIAPIARSKFIHRSRLNSIFIKRLRRSLISTQVGTNASWRLFDVSFLKKDKIYTKLKYSRVPQYDIVSGGSAALFAGFLGFLICEKFGFELLDSGDFYFLFMYIVFICYFLRLFVKLLNATDRSWSVISPKYLFLFSKNLSHLAINQVFWFKRV